MACQAHPALVKIGPVLAPSFCSPPHKVVREGNHWIRHRLSVRLSVRPSVHSHQITQKVFVRIARRTQIARVGISANNAIMGKSDISVSVVVQYCLQPKLPIPLATSHMRQHILQTQLPIQIPFTTSRLQHYFPPQPLHIAIDLNINFGWGWLGASCNDKVHPGDDQFNILPASLQ